MPVVVDQVEIVPESVRGSSEPQARPEAGTSQGNRVEDLATAIERIRERDLRRSPL